jgi:hypothetical protein
MSNEKKLESLFDMTSSPGWKILMEDLTDRVDNLKEAMTVNEASSYQIGLAQGHIKVYRELINLRNMIEIAMDQAREDQNEQANSI